MSKNGSASVKQVLKNKSAFRTISEVATELDVPQHVLRFWESRFSQVKPLKRGGGRRYYRPEDIALLKRIRELLYHDGLTIKGVQKLFRDHGVKTILSNSLSPKSSMNLHDELDQGSTNKETPKRQDLNLLLKELTDLRDILRRATRAV